MKRFNEWLAVKITEGVATMWAAYAFAVLAIFGFPYGASTVVPYVQWLSQTFIQLTMLSIIMVGQGIMTQHHKKHSTKQDLHQQTLASVYGFLVETNNARYAQKWMVEQSEKWQKVYKRNKDKAAFGKALAYSECAQELHLALSGVIAPSLAPKEKI